MSAASVCPLLSSLIPPGECARDPTPEETELAHSLHGVTICKLPGYGRAVFAARAFDLGATVISEDPLLLLSADDLETSPYARFLAVATACPQVRQSVLASMYRPDLRQSSALVHGMAARKVAREAQAAHPDELGAFSIDTLADMLLCWTFNSHAYYGGAALYTTGSKLNHSCRPNTQYRTWGVKRAQHVAIRPIAAGEEVTTSYLDVTCAMREGIMSVPARRRYLARTKLFVCECEACTTGKDLWRGARCSRCPAGAMHYDMTGLRWECGACGAACAEGSPESQGLFGESGGSGAPGASLEQLYEDRAVTSADLVETLEDQDVLSSEVEVQLEAELQEVSAALGPHHWATNRILLTIAHLHGFRLDALADLLPRCPSTKPSDGCPSTKPSDGCSEETASDRGASPHMRGGDTTSPEEVGSSTREEVEIRIAGSADRICTTCRQVYEWIDRLNVKDAPQLLWRIFEFSAASLITAAEAVLQSKSVENGLVSQWLESAGWMLRCIAPGAETWFDAEEEGGAAPSGHGLRVGAELAALQSKCNQLTDSLR